MERKRYSNFELLRICLILFVIMLHYNDASRLGAFAFIDESPYLTKLFLYCAESFSLCAVNTFVCLSGYFLIKKDAVNVRKVISLFAILIAYRLLTYVPCSIIQMNFSVKGLVGCFFPSNYYAWLYGTVFLLSPFLNLLFRCSQKKVNLFMGMIMLFFSIIPTITDYILPHFLSRDTTIFSTISLYGNGRGFTIVNFIMLYYIGGFVAIKNVNWNKTKAISCYFFCTFVVFLMMLFDRSRTISYCNVFVVFQAVSLLVLFKNFTFHSEIVNSIAKSVWGIFVIHGTFIGVFTGKWPQEYVLKSSFVDLLLHFFACILITFVVSLIWDKIWRVLLRPGSIVLNKISIFNKKITTTET